MIILNTQQQGIKTMKKQPTVINDKWCMTWIENDTIAYRNMNISEQIRYLPRIIIREWTAGEEGKQ